MVCDNIQQCVAGSTLKDEVPLLMVPMIRPRRAAAAPNAGSVFLLNQYLLPSISHKKLTYLYIFFYHRRPYFIVASRSLVTK